MSESAMGQFAEKLFHLRENRTDVRTELIASVAIFATMACTIFVQPRVIGEAVPGADHDAFRAPVMMATWLSAALATFLMGLLANYPIALAPARGENFVPFLKSDFRAAFAGGMGGGVT